MIPFTRPSSRVVRVALLCVAVAVAPRGSVAQRPLTLPDSLTSSEFWDFFTTMSERGGDFPSENFVSNEKTYQHVIPTLQRTLTPRGVYLGVGPEQNFTYIVNLKPRMAVIFDIRRQNAMLHLLYKALFELAPTRADFVARLFSRPRPTSLGASATPAEIFAAADSATPRDSAFRANWFAVANLLTVTHGFGISEADLASIRHVFQTFFEAGPDISYAYHLGAPPSATAWLVTFAQLQSATNADSVNMGFLATEENYRWLRALEIKNLVVPVVGDFGGPKAIRGVGEYLTRRGATVTAFYVSNVEQYLFTGLGTEQRFYRSVATLPIDSTSTFIRSLPAPAVPTLVGFSLPPVFSGTNPSMRIVDSNGVRIVTATGTDSTGKTVTTRFTLPPPTVTVSPTGAFISGIAPIQRTLDAFASGNLTVYAKVSAMTKTEGWKQP